MISAPCSHAPSEKMVAESSAGAQEEFDMAAYDLCCVWRGRGVVSSSCSDTDLKKTLGTVGPPRAFQVPEFHEGKVHAITQLHALGLKDILSALPGNRLARTNCGRTSDLYIVWGRIGLNGMFFARRFSLQSAISATQAEGNTLPRSSSQVLVSHEPARADLGEKTVAQHDSVPPMGLQVDTLSRKQTYDYRAAYAPAFLTWVGAADSVEVFSTAVGVPAIRGHKLTLGTFRVSCTITQRLHFPQGAVFSGVNISFAGRDDMSSYSALRTDDSDADSIESDTTLATSKPKRSAFGTWAVVVCIACTVINVVTAFFAAPSSAPTQRPFSSYTPAEIRLLRRPNQYIGLERIARPSEPLEFTNHPLVMLPIDSADKKRVFDANPRKHSTPIGTITPEVTQFMVTDTISTVVQFRAIDYGMENCELNVLFPAVGAGEESQSAISVYRLNTSYALDSSTLSYATRPPRLPKLADIPLNALDNIHWHRTFVCPTESVLTFEFACSTSIGHSCNLEWWQNARAKEFDDAGERQENDLYALAHENSLQRST
ncbi:hypothetical protein NM688_g3967 [Phlebia brevispora]|uniref:Uncharacterized protein n=1 Tax=Phlebia brevispora TaxID=194682 RepID=A0ACC1T474_9APHY|nr:hypothetical protein NM688_g3967 [Phlebia brevispora]